MSKYNSLILCEGETDQALIGSYLEATSGWVYQKSAKGFPFSGEKITTYRRDDGNTLGIWQIGGNDFVTSVTSIMNGEKQDKVVDAVVVVTDHDDSAAEQQRLQGILDTVSSSLSIDGLNPEDFQNKWSAITYNDAFGNQSSFRFCYLLVPLDSVGALETFMMNSLSEQSPEKNSVISQAKDFVKNFSSQVYLKKRREKVKAELGVSLSIISPDKSVKTMKELIDSVDWDKFVTANTQFERLREL